MGHLLVRGWILAALLLQTSVALTISAEPTVTPTPSAETSSQHHWSYISRSLPSRRPCSALYSSSVPSSRVTPTPSTIVVPSSSGIPSSSTPLVKGSSTPSSSPVPSHSVVPQPHWTYVSRPLPHRSQCSASSSGAIPASSAPASRPAPSASIAVSAPGSIPTGGPHSSIAIATQTVTATGSSTPQLTTSTILSTRTATITACPSTVPNCPASSRTTFVTTETIVVSTTICPVTEAAGATQTIATSPSVTGIAGNNGQGSGSDFTTSTVFSTRTATITACPSSVTNCPLRSKTTYLTTETLVVSTTVCPVADVTGNSGAAITQHASSPSATKAVGGGVGDSELTTSTILTTLTTTITACPSSVTNCPLRSKTTYATTETLVVGTTVYPVPQLSITQANTPPPSATGAGGEVPSITTSTILSTRVATVGACTENDINCNGSSKGTYVTTETLVVGTTVYTVFPTHTSIPAEGVEAITASTTVINAKPTSPATISPQDESSGSKSGSSGENAVPGGTTSGTTSVTNSGSSSGFESSTGSSAGSISGSGSGSGSSSGSGSATGTNSDTNIDTSANANAVYTTTITVESCSNDATCTGYISTIVMTQTDVTQPTVTASPYTYTPHSGSGAGGNQTVSASASASSAHVWPQSSHSGGMSTAAVSPTRSAVSPLYTGAASAVTRLSMLQVLGTMLVIVVAVIV